MENNYLTTLIFFLLLTIIFKGFNLRNQFLKYESFLTLFSQGLQIIGENYHIYFLCLHPFFQVINLLPTSINTIKYYMLLLLLQF